MACSGIKSTGHRQCRTCGMEISVVRLCGQSGICGVTSGITVNLRANQKAVCCIYLFRRIIFYPV